MEIRETTKEFLEEIIQNEYITRNLEIGIYNYTIFKSKERGIWLNWKSNLFVEIYKSKAYQILTNISPDTYVNSPSILTRLKNKEFFPHEIVFMSCTELSPENWAKTLEKKKKMEDMMCEIDLGQATNQFRCPKCKNNQTTYYEMQTRSADEPMTAFITCLICGKKWKKN